MGTAADDSSAGLRPALVDEAGRRTGLLWVDTGDGRDRPVWHAWEDGAALLVVGVDPAAGEQPLPGLAGGTPVKVTARSKDKGGRIVAWQAAVQLLTAGTPEWDAAADALHGARLNEQDVEGQRARWAEHCLLARLVPVDAVELPGAMPTGSHAAPPPPTPATTRGPLPFVVGRARRRRRG